MQYKNFVNTLMVAANGMEPLPTREELLDKAEQLATLLKYDDSIVSAVDEAMVSINTRMGRGVVIKEEAESNHDPEWARTEPIEWLYSSSYANLLDQEGWSGSVVQSLTDVTLDILGLLQNPRDPDRWDRRGLVIGHVQSGKTANYLSLICRAADAGYKFIIVVAGIHNNLRSQTQRRIDTGFRGRSSDPNGQREKVGVGLLMEDFPHPITLTNTASDFSKRTAEITGGKINDFNRPIIVVIKKNVSTLRALHKWLHDFNAQNNQIGDVPMLLIDDEADNASVDTSKDEISPTRTNFHIREILSLFTKKCYVGYTATPFANIFINPDAYDEDVREDLFPRDFIYSLDAPSSYFGPHKVFIDERTSSQILRPKRTTEDSNGVLLGISDLDKYVEGNPLPDSLLEALDAFFIAKAIRLARGHSQNHCSMLVNVSPRVADQLAIRADISHYRQNVENAVMANVARNDGVNDNYYMGRLKTCFDREYFGTGVTWKEVCKQLPSGMQSVRVCVINSKSKDVLDYEYFEKRQESLTAIAIGGYSLSRGLTLEGLTISYMHRTTKTYDTLMQMGRWFGYRSGYEDLCRIYLPSDSINWYSFIAEKSEDLRDQIRRMGRENKTPKEFGLYMEKHPERLLITALNKMRYAEDVDIEVNYSGSLLETHHVSKDESVIHKLENLISEYWTGNFGGIKEKDVSKGWVFNDVDVFTALNFLGLYDSGVEAMQQKIRSAAEFLFELKDKFATVDVVLIDGPVLDGNKGERRLNSQLRTLDTSQNSGVASAWKLRNRRVASGGDEQWGLTSDQLEYANHLAIRDKREDPSKSGKTSDKHYREARNKPLIMIHSILVRNGNLEQRSPAIGISFPYVGEAYTVSVKANRVYYEQWIESMDGFDSEEEDYDG